MAKIHIRQADVGQALVGTADNDVPLWDNTEKRWGAGPAPAGGALAGDANGPAAANAVTSLSPTAGGANITLGDFTSDPLEVRPVVRNPAGGTIGTITLAALATALGLVTAFDFVLTSRADLVAVVAPVADVFNLPSGSYAIKTGFALNPDERMVVQTGANVLIMGMGAGKVISGTPNNAVLFTVEANANCELICFNLAVSGDTNQGIESTGNTRMLMGSIVASGNSTEALSVVGGNFTAIGTNFSAGANSNVGQNSAGQVRLTDCRFTNGQLGSWVQTGGQFWANQCLFSGGTTAYTMSGATEMDGYLSDCDITCGVSSPVIHTGTNGDLFLNDCRIIAIANAAACVAVGPCSSLNLKGGECASTAGTPGDGVSIAGNITGGLQVIGVAADNLDDFVQWTAGTVNRAMVANCDGSNTVTTGIDWPAANIPTNGLLELGNQFNVASGSAYQNHTAATARVNRKCSSHSGGLSTETAIVP